MIVKTMKISLCWKNASNEISVFLWIRNSWVFPILSCRVHFPWKRKAALPDIVQNTQHHISSCIMLDIQSLLNQPAVEISETRTRKHNALKLFIILLLHEFQFLMWGFSYLDFIFFQGLLILPLAKVKDLQASGWAEILCLLDGNLLILSYFKNRNSHL